MTGLLRGDERLVTLTGPPGVGKTRLAVQVASEIAADFHDGVIAVSLASLADPGLVADTIRRAVGAKETATPLASTAEHLGDRRVLLVLDNFEHLLTAAPPLAELVQRCPGLRLLVTSRARLRLRGEHEQAVRPQPAADAVDLFLQRARVVGAASEPGDGAVIAEICRRLDGLPLAIELAASWTRLLALPELLARLQRRLPLLVAGARDLPERQQTMRRALDWSYGLLSPDARLLFRRLAVFVGGARLEAVEAICEPAGPLELVELVDANLVERGPAGPQSRITMLETVHEYARDLLDSSGEWEAMVQAHAAHYAGLAETADGGLTGRDQAGWLARLESEHDNMRAVLRRAEAADPKLGLQVAGHLWRFWEVRGHRREGLAWLEALIAAAPEADASLHARARNAAGNLARRMADHSAARAHYEAGLALYRSDGDQRGEGSALNNLANLAYLAGDFHRAIKLHEDNLELRRRQADQMGVGIALNNLAIAHHQAGNLERALTLLGESLSIRRARADKAGIAYCLVNIGETARLLGDHARARASLEECADLCRELGNMELLAGAVGNLGGLARAMGDCRTARTRYREGLGILVEFGELRTAANYVEGMAATAWMERRSVQAAFFYGAAAHLRATMGGQRLQSESAEHDAIVSALRRALGDSAMDAAMASGRGASLDILLAEI